MNKTIFIFRKLFNNYTYKIKKTNKMNNSGCFYVDIICTHTNCRIYFLLRYQKRNSKSDRRVK